MIGIIVNPKARRGRDPSLPERLLRLLRAAGLESAAQIEVTQDLLALRGAIERFAAAAVPLVATCGGDGTTMATVTELLRAYGPDRLPRLLLLRGGTVNTIARNLQLRGSPEQRLLQVLQRLKREGENAALPLWGQDLIRVRTPRELGASERWGCLFAAAMGARFLESYYASPRQGLVPAALLTARTIASTLLPGGGALARRLFTDTEACLWVDGEQMPFQRFNLLLAATVPDVGMGMRVTWQAAREPGRFHLVASRLPIFTMARQLGRVLSGEPLSGEPHLDRLACSARLLFPAPQPFTLDGDLFRAAEIEVDIGPRLWIVGPLN